jgi:hypothetical protein
LAPYTSFLFRNVLSRLDPSRVQTEVPASHPSGHVALIYPSSAWMTSSYVRSSRKCSSEAQGALA